MVTDAQAYWLNRKRRQKRNLSEGVGGSPIPPFYANGESGEYWEAFALAGTPDATVQTLPGRRGQQDFTQATSGNRPALRQRPDGIRYLDFAGGKSMSIPLSTSLFNYLHDGSGGEVVAFIEYPSGGSVSDFIRGTTGTAGRGIVISRQASGQNAVVAITRAVSGQPTINAILNDIGLPIAVSGRPIMLASSYKYDGGASDFEFGYDSCQSMVYRASANAPASGDASQSITIDATFGGRLYALLFINRKLTSAQRLALYAYWRSRIEYPLTIPVLTIGVGGQSNGRGSGVITTSTLAMKEGVDIYDRAEEYRRAYEPSHSITNRPLATVPSDLQNSSLFSFLLSAGAALKDDAAANTLWVPSAVGSTTLGQWDTPLTATDRTTLFGAFVYRMKKAMTEKGGAPVIIWYGHEGNIALTSADFVNGGVGNGYQAAWASLVTHLRAEIGDCPVIMVQVAADDDLNVAAGQAQVGEAQRQSELSLANVHMVVAHDVTRNASPDDVHVAAAGQQVIGARVALAIRQHVLGAAINGTGPRIVGVARSSGTITLECDKAINATAGNYGDLFRVYDNGVEATVVSSARSGVSTSKIDIVCAAPLVGPVTLTYGYKAGPAGAARTDIVKDSDNMPLPLFGPIAVP